MNHLSFGRKEEGGLGTRIPSFDLLFEHLTDLFSICGIRAAPPKLMLEDRNYEWFATRLEDLGWLDRRRHRAVRAVRVSAAKCRDGSLQSHER
jgi:hypothetical protein